MMDYMTHQVLVYQSTVSDGDRGENHRVLMDELSLHVYTFPGYRKSLREEEWSDFLLSVTNRLHTIVMNFEYRGLSFLCYLNKVLSWQLRTFYRDDQKCRNEEWIHERESIIEYDFCRENEDAEFSLIEKLKCIVETSKMTPVRMESLKHRLLLMVLKNIASLSEDDYLGAFPFLGPSKQKAVLLRSELLTALEKKCRRREILTLKRNENYFRLNFHEKKRSSCVDRHQCASLENRSCLYRRRIRRLDEQLKAIPLMPSNEDIAGVLKIPKGSVDSGLFYLRSYLEKLKEKVRLR